MISFFQEVLKGILIGIIGGIPSWIIGMWYFNKYVMPKMAPGMIKKAMETPEVQDLIKRGSGTLAKIEPFIEKLKDLKLEEIDGELINEALRSLNTEILPALKNLAETFGKRLEKPNIPEPEEPTP